MIKTSDASLARIPTPNGTVLRKLAPCDVVSLPGPVRGTVEGYGGVITHIEAISAMDTMTNPMQTAVTRNIRIAPPVPPFVSGMINVLSEVSCLNVRRERTDN